MKKIFKALEFSIVALFIMASFIACDKDFNSIESDVLGIDNANFNTDNLNLQVLAYNKKLDSLQINGFSSNLLGVFNDPAYGQTTASIITQITPTTFDPDFGTNASIDSVILRIPYFNKTSANSPDADGNEVFTIKDSLYGDSSIKLTIYQNNYFLRDFNPGTDINERQNYYSKADGAINNTDNFALTDNTIINFDDHILGLPIYEAPSFTPSAEAIVTTTGSGDDKVETRSAPALRFSLDNEFWTTAILTKEGDAVLSNANNFRDYFRGLYFKAEAENGDGSMILLNLASADANITIHYSKDSSVAGERTPSTYVFNFTGNNLNTFINDYNLITLANGDKTLGDERLYLKGAEGSMAVVDLFNGLVDCDNDGNVDDNALDCFKKSYRKVDDNDNFIVENGNFVLKKLINQAQLVIYEDEIMSTFPKDANDNDYSAFDRVYAYDIKNNTPTVDYVFDPTENTSDPYNSKFIALGQRIKDDNGVSKYKIRLTEHLNNILLRDSTNTKLGLVLSTNVNYNSSSTILKSEDKVTGVPSAALLTPRGTILYGNHQNVPDNRKMKLELFFTEPDL